MKIINGKEIALNIRNDIKNDIIKNNLTPGLAIIMVGNNPASEIYVRNKLKACEDVGVKGVLYKFDDNVSENEIIDTIYKLNNDDNIHGVIVQSPLPSNLHEDYINSFIDSNKDVDGFGIYNLGCLSSNNEKIISATPYGIVKLLEYEGINVEGKHVVIVGRSKIVGRPLALLMLNRNATVTVCHSKTENLKDITKTADILVVAIGKANFITDDFIKENAVIIDVGINRIDNKVVGDVDFDSVKDKAAYITPVPGGVGPMTIAMLLNNVTEIAKGSNEQWIKKLKKH